ncbi:hypothetical protein [Streptomyces sp. NPDC058412]|uniref:hypothetical protein n=1 Tax=Streptomyces sp. NPDC058412 TaxID=3346486 RepID=UPI0036641F96
MRGIDSAAEAVLRYRRPDPSCWETVVEAVCEGSPSRDASTALVQAGRAVAGQADRIAGSLAELLRFSVPTSGHTVQVHAFALAGLGDVRALPALPHPPCPRWSGSWRRPTPTTPCASSAGSGPPRPARRTGWPRTRPDVIPARPATTRGAPPGRTGRSPGTRPSPSTCAARPRSASGRSAPLLRGILAAEKRLGQPLAGRRILADGLYVRTLAEALARIAP